MEKEKEKKLSHYPSLFSMFIWGMFFMALTVIVGGFIYYSVVK